MNKIKVIYDTAKKMKAKESIKGAFKAEALKGEDKILDHSCSFERNGQGFRVKGRTMLEADCDGKRMKLENTIDLQKDGRCEHHHFCRGVHASGMKIGGCRITTILGLLSSIKLEEKEDGSAILSLETADMPEDLKTDLHEMLMKCHEQHEPVEGCKEHHMCMKELHDMENMDFTLRLVINKDKEIERVTVDLKGEKQEAGAGKHQMKLAAELCLE